MNTQTLNKKIELIQWLSTLEDNFIIEKLLKFRKEETKDWWHSISEDEKELKPHSSARKLYEKW